MILNHSVTSGHSAFLNFIRSWAILFVSSNFVSFLLLLTPCVSGICGQFRAWLFLGCIIERFYYIFIVSHRGAGRTHSWVVTPYWQFWEDLFLESEKYYRWILTKIFRNLTILFVLPPLSHTISVSQNSIERPVDIHCEHSSKHFRSIGAKLSHKNSFSWMFFSQLWNCTFLTIRSIFLRNFNSKIQGIDDSCKLSC